MGKLVTTIDRLDYFDSHAYTVWYSDGTKDVFKSSSTVLGIIDKPGLRRYYGNRGVEAAEAYRDERGEIGSLAHHACYVTSNGGYVLFEPPTHISPQISTPAGLVPTKDLRAQNDRLIAQCKASDRPWIRVHNQEIQIFAHRWACIIVMLQPRFKGAEIYLYSLKHRLGGTADYIAYLPEGEYKVGRSVYSIVAGWYIIDIKTGTNVGLNEFYQVASYFVMAEESQYLPNGEPIKLTGTIIVHLNRDSEEGWGLHVHYRQDVEKHWRAFQAADLLWNNQNPNWSSKVMDFPPVIHISGMEQVPTGFQLLNFTAEKEREKAMMDLTVPLGDAIEDLPVTTDETAERQGIIDEIIAVLAKVLTYRDPAKNEQLRVQLFERAFEITDVTMLNSLTVDRLREGVQALELSISEILKTKKKEKQP